MVIGPRKFYGLAIRDVSVVKKSVVAFGAPSDFFFSRE